MNRADFGGGLPRGLAVKQLRSSRSVAACRIQIVPKGGRHATTDVQIFNARPRKALGWKTPAEALDEWLS
jgi:hypothetical protein